MAARALVGVLLCCSLSLPAGADLNQRGGAEDRGRSGRRSGGRGDGSFEEGHAQPEGPAAGQLPGAQDDAGAAGLLKSLLDTLQPTKAQGSSPACAPYKLPAGVSSFQEFCKGLGAANDTAWDERYRSAAGPATGAAPLPLRGCVLGCVVGAESYQRGLMWGAGAWSGKW